MKPEDRLHLLAPYLPTDRFRAALDQRDLPTFASGAALQADLSGFTQMTVRLVAEYGPERASEALRVGLNSMFEALAGQIFHHGGSVIRFLGDGFLAWFDDAQAGSDLSASGASPVPAIFRAIASGLEVQAWMRFFPHLRIKVFVSMGDAHRWVIGDPGDRFFDVISGPALHDLSRMANIAQPGQVLLHANTTSVLRGAELDTAQTPDGHWIVGGMPERLAAAARSHRWPAWQARGDAQAILSAVQPFVEYAVRAQIESGLHPDSGGLRLTVPMFLEVRLPDGDAEAIHLALDRCVRVLQAVLVRYGGRLMSVETPGGVCVLFAVLGLLTAAGENEDDAARAMRAALEFRAQMDTPGEGGGGCVRGGISRGVLYAGMVGGEVRHDFSIIGDETNTAARLMDLAAPGQILASEAARAAAGSAVRLRALKPALVRGRLSPLPIYAVD